ncbi:MAG: tyrosine transporter [Parachlamydiaceae bacterium]|nr:tyrosine transporter [Parachlamydiaceae bacterium]
MSNRFGVTIGALLVAGTSIGGGMLALPILTSVTGFVPSLFIYLLCWLFMASTGLLFLEITQWMHKEANIISMANFTLGRAGKIAAWVLYLFLFYSLNIAYIIESGDMVVEFANGQITDWMGPVIFLVLFAQCIVISTAVAAKVNLILMVGLILSYLCFVFLGIPFINPALLNSADWLQAPKALPIAFTAFAYQGIIPTLASYLHYDIAKGRKAILIGSFIPLIAYVIWQTLIMGIVPIEGANGLKAALGEDLNAIQAMKYFINSPSIYAIGQSFAFFALVTSFLGVTLGLRDFLADGLNIQQGKYGKVYLTALIFIPPLLVAMMYPHIFLIMLEYAGGIGCALLLGLLPIIMVWRGRYHFYLKEPQQLLGGKFILAILAIFVICEVAFELFRIKVKLFG